MEPQIYRCTPRQVRGFIIDCFEAGRVPYVKGSPGTGKSSIFNSVAQELNLWKIDNRISTADQTDFNGLPAMSNGFAKFHPFEELFPLETTPIPEGYDGWMIFFDEYNAGQRQVRAAAFKVLLDRMIGQRKMHKNVCIGMAGNLDTDRAITNIIATSEESRVITLLLESNFDEWYEDVAVPQNYDSRIISFLNWKKSYLNDFRPDHEGATFCCERTWEFMDSLVKGKEVTNYKMPLYAGTITAGVAAEFVQHCQIHKELITITDILKDPGNCRVPTETPQKWATISHMMEYVTEDNFGDLAEYASRFDLAFRILFFRTIMVKEKKAVQEGKQESYRHHPAFRKAMVELVKYLT